MIFSHDENVATRRCTKRLYLAMTTTNDDDDGDDDDDEGTRLARRCDER